MAHIKQISFAHVGRNEGCCCDRCGQYIRNIVTVRYAEGLTLNYGQDCFDKLYKNSRLNDYGKKLMRKALKKIEDWSKRLDDYKSGKINEANDESYAINQPKENGAWYQDSYWTGKPYDEYREWMINDFIPVRLAEAQKEIDRFAKVNFEP